MPPCLAPIAVKNHLTVIGQNPCQIPAGVPYALLRPATLQRLARDDFHCGGQQRHGDAALSRIGDVWGDSGAGPGGYSASAPQCSPRRGVLCFPGQPQLSLVKGHRPLQGVHHQHPARRPQLPGQGIGIALDPKAEVPSAKRGQIMDSPR